MDRERLKHLVEDPARVQREDLVGLRSMTERFPWFSGAHLLLAVGEHAAGDVLFDEQLRVTAAHLPSRSVLFDQAHQDRPSRPTVIPLPPPPEAVARVEHPRPPVVPVLVAEEPPVKEEIEEDVVVELEEILSKPLPVEAVAPEVDAVPSVGPTPIPPVPAEEDPLDLLIRQAAVASGYDALRSIPATTPALAPVPPATRSVAPSIPPVAAFAPVSAAPIVPPTPVNIPEPTPERTPMAPQPTLSRNSRLRFTEWLERTDEVVEHDPSATADAVESSPAPMAPSTAAGPVKSTKELVDGFIQLSMPVAPKRTEFFTPQQAAKRSLQDDGLVSETLARVYEKQGNFAKAMEAYQRLALKHPDKSAYFAALSKALEGRSNK